MAIEATKGLNDLGVWAPSSDFLGFVGVSQGPLAFFLMPLGRVGAFWSCL